VKRNRRRAAGAWLLAALVVAAPGTVSPSGGRLDRFRELAASGLSVAQLLHADTLTDAHREIYALLDEEIVESLASGGVFASAPFLQDRLDAFGEAWGGAAIRIARVGPLLVGGFQLLGDAAFGNSVRVYGPLRDEAALLGAFYRPGRPAVHPLPGGGDPRLLVVWDGPPSGRGSRALRLEVVRVAGDSPEVAWTSTDLFPDGLLARGYVVRGAEVRVRYELRYPGWTPGCAGQTEQEDVYRWAPGAAAPARVSRQQHDAWHRELHAEAERFFAALATQDEARLAALVPDARLRARLPVLSREPVCDAADRAGREAVSVAATSAEGSPWSVSFRRTDGRWRVTGAAPVLQ
jgi:hypothetical protein